MPTLSITDELIRVNKLEYLNQMSVSDLAFWLIHSFHPARYRDPNDYIKQACQMIVDKSSYPDVAQGLIDRLWAMFDMPPDDVLTNVVSFRRKS